MLKGSEFALLALLSGDSAVGMTGPAVVCRDVTVDVVRVGTTHPHLPELPVNAISVRRGDPTPGQAAVDLSVIGPLLGGLDSKELALSWSCLDSGVRLEAAITRVGIYSGAALKNVLWRPYLRARLINSGNPIKVEIEFKLRRADRTAITEAVTPIGGTASYPIRLGCEVSSQVVACPSAKNAVRRPR